MTWTCGTCGQPFGSWEAAQRHANGEHDGGRITVEIESRKRP